MLKDMFKKTYTLIDTKYKHPVKSEEPSIPQGLWRKCNKCGQPIYVEDVKNNFYICPKCSGYFRVHAYRRIEMVIDKGTFEEWDKEMEFGNPLNFPGYEKKVLAAKEKTKLNEAIVTGKGKINGRDTVIGVCDARFLMSSMGHIVGEKIANAVERATKEQLPVIIFACSGGARMQEGLVSLMQMAKTSAALKKHHEAGQLFISVLTDPTTGGVTASFAMLGDIILAEPNALIGFAGPRVIEQTIGQKLPDGFQRSEFLLEHGFVDKIVEREDLKDTLGQILKMHEKKSAEECRQLIQDARAEEARLADIHNQEETQEVMPESTEQEDPEKEHVDNGKESGKSGGKTAWDKVLLSRQAGRPVASDYIRAIFDEFIEFHGDRYFKDDGAIIGGIATFHGIPVTVIGQQKGKNTKDNIKRNFGMPSPEGYRKALRLMKQAEAFGRPIICFVDTPGAFCGLEAEENGQGEAIARNLFEMSSLKVPVLTIMIGEGGSGGALAMAVANEVWMLENAIYSILSPEGFASILWKDSKKAPEAAKVMKITARDICEMNLIEQVIKEEEPASKETLPVIAGDISHGLEEFLKKYLSVPEEEIVRQRYERFRRM
ncbi:acetyl-CoA carboxylase, carboxyltransferase subunit beta [Clostridium sp. AM58-1XD]|uniref:acetyl-CoA carboxylase, carboxyltransferase subunit beta n=1 Tax=Clostridium sp. AM58-1XD TaxID=2292307 RepID=UPI000E46CF15|nr:acetyl-CoA carboxylase, carboxyltransferase subunit beta [Clostridium sp. AM58-1XD]RGZ01163.1 acetyl-CoA carboxylase carboxyltransferase subunit beta [Clostridium sp. AM58-1XD]